MGDPDAPIPASWQLLHDRSLKERFGAPRIAAAGLLAVGIGLMLHAR
ncbi:hypothetical protein [Streptomyces djakartensis]|nr:hypothetical protein [Streptomyces djakartensis]